MSCADTEKYLEIALGGALAANEQAELEAHIGACDQCSAAVAGALRDKERLGQALRPHRFRESTGQSPVASLAQPTRFPVWLKIAAALLVFLGLAFAAYRLSDRPRVNPDVSPQQEIAQPPISIRWAPPPRQLGGFIDAERPPMAETELIEEADAIVAAEVLDKAGSAPAFTATLEIKKSLKGELSPRRMDLAMKGRKIHLECGASDEPVAFEKGDICLLFLKSENGSLVVFPDRADNVFRKLASCDDPITAKIARQLALSPVDLLEGLNGKDCGASPGTILCTRASKGGMAPAYLLIALKSHRKNQSSAPSASLANHDAARDLDCRECLKCDKCVACDTCMMLIECLAPLLLKNGTALSATISPGLQPLFHSHADRPVWPRDFSPRNEKRRHIRNALLAWWEELSKKLAKWADAEPIPAGNLDELIRKLGDDDWATREKATNDLFELGPQCEKTLRLAGNSTDPEVATRAASILSHIEEYTAFLGDTLNYEKKVK